MNHINLRSQSRSVLLHGRLLATADLLKRRMASQIAEEDIEDYIDLHWLEWQGGGLRLTITGENVCRQLRLKLRALDASGRV